MRLSMTVLEARDVPAANLQFIQNSPFATAAKVDVYLNNALFLDDFAFQSATAYLSVASNTKLKIDITAATAKNNAVPMTTTTLTLADASSTVAIIAGDPSKPTGSTAFQLATATGRAVSGTPAAVEALAFNGSPDLASIDLRVRDEGLLGSDIPFAGFGTSYFALDAVERTVDILPGPGGLQLQSSVVDLADNKGHTVVFLTSGFLNPATVNDPSLKLIGVRDDGVLTLYTGSQETAFAAAAATKDGGVVLLATPRGETVTAVNVFPGMTTSPRVASADLDGDGRAEIIAGTGPGVIGTVRILDGATGNLLREIEPFGVFTGGINVAAGDVTGDGVPDYAISPDDGGGPRVRVFNGATGAQIADFFGIDDATFRGGARAAIGDLNGDGKGDLLVSAGIGGGPRIALFNGALLGMNGGPKFAGDFFAFEPELRNGAFIASGDVNGDGFDDLIVGGGPGGGPRVRVLDAVGLLNPTFATNVLADFFAGDVNDRQGARITAKDVDHDGRDDIIAGGVPGGAALRIFLAPNLPTTGIANAEVAVASFNGGPVLDQIFVG